MIPSPDAIAHGVASFRVTGPRLIRLIRRMVLDGQWVQAQNLLMDDMEGMTSEIAEGLLRGTHALTPDFGLIDQDPTDSDLLTWQEEIRSVYAGRTQHQGRWYAPYAVVGSYGYEDAKTAGHGEVNADRLADGVRSGARAMHYADDAETDISLGLPYPREDGKASPVQQVLFRLCEAPPPWLPAPTSLAGALTAWVEIHGHTLDRRGWNYRRSADSVSPPKKAFFRARPDWEAQQLAVWRAEITARADAMGEEGWLDLPEVRGDEGFRVPRAPFIQWALRGTDGVHLAPAWEPVCPPGVKSGSDSVYHTDWLVGAGFHPDGGYAEHILRVSYAAKAEIQREVLGFDAAVLSGRGKDTGLVVHPQEGEETPGRIAVIPAARPGYAAAVRTARAVITATGGELCHLAVVGREQGQRIVRVADCMERYPAGTCVTVDCDNGHVKIAGN